MKMAVNKNPTMSQKFVAEVIGAAFLVLVGPGRRLRVPDCVLTLLHL